MSAYLNLWRVIVTATVWDNLKQIIIFGFWLTKSKQSFWCFFIQNLRQTLSPILHQHMCSVNTLCKTEREHYFHTLAIKFKKIHIAESSSKLSTQVMVYVFGMSKSSRYRNSPFLVVRDGWIYDAINWKSEEYIKQIININKISLPSLLWKIYLLLRLE